MMRYLAGLTSFTDWHLNWIFCDISSRVLCSVTLRIGKSLLLISMFNFCCNGIFNFIFRTVCWKLQVASSRKSEYPSQSNVCVELWNLVTAVRWVIQCSAAAVTNDILTKWGTKFFFSLQAINENSCENTRFILMIFAEYNQKDATFHNLFISVRRSTCFRRVFRP